MMFVQKAIRRDQLWRVLYFMIALSCVPATYMMRLNLAGDLEVMKGSKQKFAAQLLSLIAMVEG